ncbi:MAG: Ger(x)C family spore germination C-terminal domain-containing protein [Eubacteriales bacterium]|nr:Ger(x)C family spore germination C-terminal domain-containing protein [Eubacteriales bacterium]
MRKVIVIVLILSMTFLTGCYDYLDAENMSYVTAVSVDMGQGGQYEYCFQFVNPLSEEGEFITYIAQGNSLHAAINKVSQMITRRISFTHIKLVAVSMKAAEELDKAIAGFNASRFYRPDIILGVVYGDKASEMFSSFEPELEGNAARYYELEFSAQNSLSKVSTTVKDYFSYNSCALPLISGSTINGIAVIKNGHLFALGDEDDAICYNLLTKGAKQSVFSDALISCREPSVKESWKKGKPHVEYSIKVDVSPLIKYKNTEKVKYELESILTVFTNKYIIDGHVDLLNSTRHFKKHFLTEKEWKKQNIASDINDIGVKVGIITTETKKGRSVVN